ncbi:methyltransferase [Flavobacterium sp. TP390]|uniref:Methyltransferase n=1 Tax=Flavobacterium profundi TaxID=1774945 RepID=A0A6I4IUP8_9FLAO|nr:class I SAM-dependent methyltransferase [Flavobacterium profundi]MVO10610.1 methyltransferase [Flavobacterium profundi]
MKDYIGNELELFKYAINWKQYYKSKINKYLKDDLLEVGAGIGETTFSLCDGSQKSWICIEPDAALINIIKEKKENGYLPSMIEIKKGTIDNLDKEQKFDTIIYIDVIEHIEMDSQELIKASNFLKPNGHLIILVPAHNYLFSKFDAAIGHFRRYNKKSLEKIIPKDLLKKELIYLDSVGLLASLMNKWFLKQDYPKLKQITFWDRVMIPFSKIIDRLIFYKLGKTVVGVWQKKG